MTKKEIQKRVTRKGEPIPLKDFKWDEKTKTFSSELDRLSIDFSDVHNCVLNVRNHNTIKAYYSVTINAGYHNVIDAGHCATINTWHSTTIKTGDYSIINTGDQATIKAGDFNTINVGDSSTIDVGYSATIKAEDYATIDAGDYATIKAGKLSIIIIRKIYLYSFVLVNGGEVKTPNSDYSVALVKYDGEENFHKENETDHYDIFDGIPCKVISHKKNVYKVINEGSSNESFVVTDGERCAHGNTIKEAKESLIYKIADRDTSKYDSFTLDSEITFEEGVLMYRTITGSCESQTKEFAEKHKFKGKKTIREIIEITKGQYNHNVLTAFFKK